MVLRQYSRPNDQLIYRVAEAISKYPRLVLTSMGSAYYSLVPMYYALSQIHPNVHLVETAELMRRPFFPDTAYLIMSRSGVSGEIAKYSATLRKKGLFLIAITMTPESTLAKNASLVLSDPTPFDHLICTKAYTSMALMGLLLSSAMSNSLDQKLLDDLSAMLTWLENNKQDLLLRTEAIPWLGKPLSFLSEGVGVGLSMSGCLWMEEGARLHADYSSYSQFRHGSLEMVDDAFYGVSIQLDNDPIAEKYRRFIVRKGGQLAVIKVNGDPQSSLSIPSFDLPAPYRIIPAAMPIQMIAYHSGVRRGHVPGEMRYLNWVVK